MSSSAQANRVLVAVVTGDVGARIQLWREKNDPDQARRLPPHATLCYKATVDDEEALEKQVHHAFATPVTVRLGPVKEFEHGEGTFYVHVGDTDGLDEARRRLYDDTHLALTKRAPWTWHVTCVRYPRDPLHNIAALRAAKPELDFDLPWRIDRVAHLELRGDRYEPLAEWDV